MSPIGPPRGKDRSTRDRCNSTVPVILYRLHLVRKKAQTLDTVPHTLASSAKSRSRYTYGCHGCNHRLNPRCPFLRIDSVRCLPNCTTRRLIAAAQTERSGSNRGALGYKDLPDAGGAESGELSVRSKVSASMDLVNRIGYLSSALSRLRWSASNSCCPAD